MAASVIRFLSIFHSINLNGCSRQNEERTFGNTRRNKAVAEKEALKKGTKEKCRELTEKGSEVYAKA